MAQTYKFSDLKQALKKGAPAAVINDIVANLSAADINKAVHTFDPGLEVTLFNVATLESLQKIAASLDSSVASGIANLPPVFLAFDHPSYADTSAADSFADHTGTFQATDINNNTLAFGVAGGTATAQTIAGVTYNEVAESDYGRLLLNTNTGAYRFMPDADAVNGLSAAASKDFTITVSDGKSIVSNTFTVTFAGVNDVPVAANDTASATEAGGTANGTPGSDAIGSVITGPGADTDADAGQVLTIASVRTGPEGGSGSLGTVGVALTGQYGSLTLNADGSYRYAVAQDNAAVHSLAAGESLTDVFTYTVRDPGGLSDTAQLSITVNGANDAAVAEDDVLPTRPVGEGWVLNAENGHYYRIVDEVMSWDAAVARAAADGGYLATITSATEQAFVAGTFAAGVNRPNDSRPWLGAFSDNAADPASWHWTTGPEAGMALQYTDWVPGEPNGWPGEPAGALELEPDVGSPWNDAPTWFGGRIVLEEFGGMPNETTLNENGSVTVSASTLLANDRTSDHGEVLSFGSVAALSARGAAVSVSGGVITYNAASSAALQALAFGQTISDSFVYNIDDGQGLTSPGTVTLTVGGVNDAPVIVSGGGVSYPASGGTIAISPAGTISDVDSLNFNGGSLRVAYTTVRVTTDLLSIGNQGNGEGQIGLSGNTISFGGAVIGTFFGGTVGSALNIAFTTDAATPTAVQALLHDIRFSNSSTGVAAATRGLQFTLNDGDGTAGGGTAIGTATTTISIAANQAPQTNAVSATGDEDHAIAVALSGSDADGSVASFRIASLPANGILYSDAALSQRVSIGSLVTAASNAATLYFKPDADWSGSTSFQYAARDTRGLLDASPATASIAVNAVNDPAAISSVVMDPTHHDGSFESNSVFNINQAPTTLSPVWTVTSTGFGGLLSNPPHITVLAGADGADAIFADGPSTQSTTATSHNLLGGGYSAVHEGDVLAWSFQINSWSATSTGVLKFNFGNADVVVGTGAAGDNDLATFRTISGTYTATAADAAGGQLHAILSIVTGTPDPSSGENNVYGDNVHISVLGAAQTLIEGDTAAAISTGGTLTISDIDSPATFVPQDTAGQYGTFSIGANGVWTYTASSAHDELTAGQQVKDTFVVVSQDGTQAGVNIFIKGTNDAPVSGNDSASGDEDTPIVTGNVLANDSDPDNTLAASSITGFTQGSHGGVVNNGNGSFTYTPATNYNGTDSFTYTVSDGELNSTATVNLTVNPLPDAPVAVDDISTDNADRTDPNHQAVTGNVLLNDGDPDGDSAFVFNFSSATQTATAGGVVEGVYGDLHMQADGTWNYLLNANDPDTVALPQGEMHHEIFSYTIGDGHGLFDTATVTVGVHAS